MSVRLLLPRRSGAAMVIVLLIALLIPWSGQPADAAPAPRPAIPQMRVFQQGVDGYAGVHDTWVSDATWDTSRLPPITIPSPFFPS